jgi:hypothetical protein
VEVLSNLKDARSGVIFVISSSFVSLRVYSVCLYVDYVLG